MPPSELTSPGTPPSGVQQTLDELNVVNAGYVAEMYEQFRRDPSSVEGEWRALFESGLPPGSPLPAPAVETVRAPEREAA